MSQPERFEIRIHDILLWNIELYVHPTGADFYKWRKKVHGAKEDNTDASCIQNMKVDVNDRCVAEIHLNKEKLRLSNIVHEATHAAWHFARIMGYPLVHIPAGRSEENTYEGWVAWHTGRITHRVVELLLGYGYEIDLKTY